MPHAKLARRRPDAARVLAYRTLRAVSEQGAYANLELGRRLADTHLEPRDAAFATELVSGTCRLAGTYDRIIAEAAGRALKPDVTDALRLGAHQLLSMRTPSRAAVAATVDLAGAEIGEKVTGLVNAVLRKVGARTLDEWVALLGEQEDDLGRLALRTHHPRWIVEAYVDLLGGEAEVALAANNEPPTTTLVVRPGLASTFELGDEAEPTRFSPFGARRAGNPGDVPAVRDGRAGVQDEGSQLVAWALAKTAAAGTSLAKGPAIQPTALTALGPWLDLCAGPGGKAALLAGLAAQAGSRLVASELQRHRAELVAQGLRAYAPVIIDTALTSQDAIVAVLGVLAAGGGTPQRSEPARVDPHPSDGPQPGTRPAASAPIVVCADGTDLTWPDDTFARVMADVPCTGLGALRRRPEARWRRQPSDVDALVPLQRRLLANALRTVEPGGVVAYVTCSPHRRETVEVVDAVLADHPEIERLHAADYLPDVPDAALGDDVQLWPHRHGTDAMYLALLRRTGDR